MERDALLCNFAIVVSYSHIWLNQQNLPKLQVTVYLFILYLSFIALQPANETCKWFAIVNPQGWDPWPQTNS